MEEKIKQRRSHRLNMEDRKRLEMTGISDVISFDLNKILLETDYGVVTVKGDNLHVNRLSVEKGELEDCHLLQTACSHRWQHTVIGIFGSFQLWQEGRVIL